MSRHKASYKAANGTSIKNHGQRNLSAMDESWNPFKMEAQVADVSTSLGSVFQICRSGNIVAFDDQGGVVMNKTTGRRIPIKLRQGSYEMDMWVPKPSRIENGKNHDPLSDRNHGTSLEEMSMDFIRQGL